MPFHTFHVLTYLPSVGPALVGAPHKVAFILTQPALAPLSQRCIDPVPSLAMQWPFLHLFPLLCHMLWAPMPQVLQQWLYQPCQQTQRQKCLWPWQVQHCPQLAALPHLCMSMPEGSTCLVSVKDGVHNITHSKNPKSKSSQSRP